MPITPDRISRLREFGLSEYAARAYLALLDLGLTEARDVSNLSRVPQAKVYQVLDQLHDKGLAIILPEFPKKYAPVPFEEFLDRIHRQHIDAAGTIEKTRKELTTLFSVTGNVDAGDRGDFTVVRGRRNVLEKLAEVFGRATSDLLVIGTRGLASRPQYLLDRAAGPLAQQANVRFLLPLDHENAATLAPLVERCGMRVRDSAPGSSSENVAIVVADGRQALLIHFVPDDGDLANGRDVAVFTDQEAMVGAILAMAAPLWDHAPSYAAYLEQVATGRERSFTRLYSTSEEKAVALREAIGRGVRDYCVLNPDLSGIPLAHTLETVPGILAEGGRVRAILARVAQSSADRFHEVVRAAPGAEARHMDPPASTRFWILDEREAIVSFGSPESKRTIAIHTNSPEVVRALRAEFSDLWERAVPYEQRLADAARYPDLLPSDVGVGRMFRVIQEAVLLVGADGRVRVSNPAADQLFGRAPGGLTGAALPDLLPSVTPESLAGSAPESIVPCVARRADGTTVDVEATSGAFSGAPADLRYVVLREAPGREKRPVHVRLESSRVSAER